LRTLPLALLLTVLTLPSQTLRAEDDKSTSLVVLIVVDQLRGDYLDAFRDQFSPDGFNRLMRDGTWYANAYLPYGMTATGPGHATLSTGVSPSIHGIVANDWKEIASAARSVYCCGDDSVRILGLPEGKSDNGRSPRQMRSATLGDAIKAATGGRGKVWGVALKDRSAILPAGQRADGAVWWDIGSGHFISSTYYGDALPGWAEGLNRERYADRYFHQSWDRLLPAGLYGPRLLTAPGTRATWDKHNTGRFPKVLGEKSESPDKKYYNSLLNSPFGNELVFESARRVVTAEQLGGDDAVDLLCVGLSSNDVVGHSYGPDAEEVMDCTLRTDRQLAEFLGWLDSHVGAGRYLIALSSDHGVAPLPEYVGDLGQGGGRLDSGKIRQQIERELQKRFPRSEDAKLIYDLSLPWLYLDADAVTSAGLSLDEVARTAARAAVENPGIERAVAVCDLPAADNADDPVVSAIRNCVYPGRTGHVYLHWARYWYKESKQAGHGAAHDYDQHVPVMLMGPGIGAGRVHERVSPTGMVRTICAALGIAPPSSACDAILPGALALPQKQAAP